MKLSDTPLTVEYFDEEIDQLKSILGLVIYVDEAANFVYIIPNEQTECSTLHYVWEVPRLMMEWNDGGRFPSDYCLQHHTTYFLPYNGKLGHWVHSSSIRNIVEIHTEYPLSVLVEELSLEVK